LSWSTILKKREGYRKAFDNFDAWKISQYSEDDVARLLVNAEIIRNRRKIMATIANAKAFLQVQKSSGALTVTSGNLWMGKSIQNAWTKITEIPASTLSPKP